MQQEVTRMVKVLVEVCNGAVRFNVSVKAQSIERAVSVVRGSYSGCVVRVKFPIDPEGFFVKEPPPGQGYLRLTSQIS
jgi:hypothetical protein